MFARIGWFFMVLGARLVQLDDAEKDAIPAKHCPWICDTCGALWRKHDDGTFSLYSAEREPGGCCDNAENILDWIRPCDCDNPPPGWFCTRPYAHEGPCAALPEKF